MERMAGVPVETWVRSTTTLGSAQGRVGRRAKDSWATWEEARKGESFASSLFLFSYGNNSSSTLVLFKGKVLLSWAHCKTLCRNQVPSSGITPHRQSAAVTPSNCFPELNVCSEVVHVLQRARAAGDTRTRFSTGSGGPCKDTRVGTRIFPSACCKESSFYLSFGNERILGEGRESGYWYEIYISFHSLLGWLEIFRVIPFAPSQRKIGIVSIMKTIWWNKLISLKLLPVLSSDQRYKFRFRNEPSGQ